MEDDLMKARMELKKLKRENEELSRSFKEHKQACDTYEIEIKNLKEKLG